MKDLFDALAQNGFAKNENVTLEYVISNTWQDAKQLRMAQSLIGTVNMNI